MAAKCRRAAAQIHGNIEHSAVRNPNQFALRLNDLIVNAAQHVLLRERESYPAATRQANPPPSFGAR